MMGIISPLPPTDTTALLLNYFLFTKPNIFQVRIETNKYFKYLINMITSSGGSVELGTNLTKEEVEKLKKSGHVVNCLGNNAGIIGNFFQLFCQI